MPRATFEIDNDLISIEDFFTSMGEYADNWEKAKGQAVRNGLAADLMQLVAKQLKGRIGTLRMLREDVRQTRAAANHLTRSDGCPFDHDYSNGVGDEMDPMG